MDNEIMDMFNTITPSDYLISNPFSSSCNKVFKKIFKPEDFFSYFYFMSNMTYERLASITTLSTDTTKNTVFITGFRGCGKTCFMNLLNSIIESKYVIPDYDICKEAELSLLREFSFFADIDEKNKEISEVDDNYCLSSNNILNELRPYLAINGYAQTNSSISKYINKTLKGKSIFLNFEKGNSKNEKKPFEMKFINQIESLITELIERKENSELNPFSLLCNFYHTNEATFDNLLESENSLLDFFDFLESKVLDTNSFSEIKRQLYDILNNLNLEQDIFVLVFLHIANNICLKTKQHLFFILDNMDIVYKNNILDQSMNHYANFIEDMNSLVQDIDKNKGNNNVWIQFYEQANFIFAMRETTAMQIADQFLDGLELVAKYFDISMDTDKAYVVEKKYSFINKYKNRISNKDFINQMNYIHWICTDTYVKKNIFPMFNNDFKRSILCIAEICNNNINILDEKIKLMKTKKAYNKNGARGILFRLIYDEFKKEHYFDQIGVEWRGNHQNSFTPSRIILTILYNLLPEYGKNENNVITDFDKMNPPRLSLNSLYKFVAPFMNEKTFVRSLVGMFNLKNARTWNHLVTFDNIKDVTENELIKVLSSTEVAEQGEVMIRITCAGSNYVKFICTHYEFFSCRFTKKSTALFCEYNSKFSQEYKCYNFENVLNKVYESVESCCNKLASFNERLLNNLKEDKLFESDYIFKNKNEKEGRLHEERIIHTHITYIDNYRIHLINDIYSDNIQEINEKIILVIEKYIKLLQNELFGEMSKALFKECSCCIKYIKSKKYNDNTTEISRDSYKILLESGCIE